MKLWLQQLGWQGVVGIALLLLAGLFYQQQLLPLQQQLEFLEEQQLLDQSNKRVSPDEPQQQLTQLVRELPTDQQALDILAKIYMLADECGVEYQQAQYQLVTQPRREYRISMPASSAYPNLRYFVSRILAEQPNVSLDQLNLQRNKIDDAVFHADIRLTIFLQPLSAVQP